MEKEDNDLISIKEGSVGIVHVLQLKVISPLLVNNLPDIEEPVPTVIGAVLDIIVPSIVAHSAIPTVPCATQ
jgi:hypothetical protein